MPRDGDDSSDSSSSGSDDSTLRGRRRSDSGSSSGSSWESRSDEESDGGYTQGPDESTSSALSGWSILLLVFVLAAAVGLAVFLANRSGGAAGGRESRTAPKAGATTGDAENLSQGSTTGQRTYVGSAVPAATSVPADFLENVASKFSMSAASIPSLTMPTSALPSPTAAQSYVQDSWPFVKGTSEFLTFETDPLEGDEVVLQIKYEKGSYAGTDEADGGIGNMQLAVFGEGKKRAMASYEVGFNEGFDFVKGGKLPGIYGGDPNAGCTGGRNNPACFSARMMWRQEGAGEVYAYVPIYDGLCDSDGAYCHGEDGISFNRGSFTFEAGSYNTITEVVIFNSDADTANGVLALYAGETLAFERHDLVFRVNESVSISSFIISSFFGGSSEDYASSADAYTYYRNMRFFEGDEASSDAGATVKASSG
ncbi:hypothetical protein JCM11251_004755 [Rhodosporidiobolus azoricus]